MEGANLMGIGEEPHQHQFEDDDGISISCPQCGLTREAYTQAAREDAQRRLKAARDSSEFVESMKRTAASMDGIDNSWNLLHIASGVLPALLAKVDPNDGQHEAAVAKSALAYADALLKEWRKYEGGDYAD